MKQQYNLNKKGATIMEINEKIYALADRVKQLHSQIKTEESTKQSLILPFFQILGYDIFNPLEFCPEYIADVGIKKNEKVDYVIIVDGKPMILIEAKSCSQNIDKLEKHDSQLFRYYATTEARFAILTNGIRYRFFADLDSPNKMDQQPFFELNMLDLNDQTIDYLENFMKSKLSVENILNSASELKYLNLIKSTFRDLVEHVPDEILKLIVSKVYEGPKTQAVLDKFKPLVKRGITQYINEKMSSKFNETLSKSESTDKTDEMPVEEAESKIITTIDELNAFAVVKAILRKHVSANRLVYRDTESYLGILLDDNNRKWICRIELDKKRFIQIPDEEKKPQRFQINNIDDIFDYSDQLIAVLKRYL